jgi:hypothetical protein
VILSAAFFAFHAVFNYPIDISASPVPTASPTETEMASIFPEQEALREVPVFMVSRTATSQPSANFQDKVKNVSLYESRIRT